MKVDQYQAKNQVREMLLGSDAVAHGVKLCQPEVIAAYPITPQTHIVETLSQMVDQGKVKSDFFMAESEMSAIAACFGAVAAGSRSFTATSSQGLAMMHEMLHWFSGSRLPMVMVNANRSLGAPWNIWTDQSDTFAQRDTGWLQIYCETAQEALDNIILAYWLSERIMLPIMVMIDGFFLSHAMEQLFLPDKELVDQFLPKYEPPYFLDTEHPMNFDPLVTQDDFYHLKKIQSQTTDLSTEFLQQGYRRFAEYFSRTYDNVETYNIEEAETVIVCSGALTGTVRAALDLLTDQGKVIGLVKLRLFRPFPRKELIEILSDKKEVLVFNRAVSFGAGGTLTQELRSGMYGLQNGPIIYDVIVSLGGKEVSPETVIQVLEHMDELSPEKSNWLA